MDKGGVDTDLNRLKKTLLDELTGCLTAHYYVFHHPRRFNRVQQFFY